MGLENIEHLVVVMFENRSFDNLLGWLYDNETDPPKSNLPPQTPPVFEGLASQKYSNTLGQTTLFASRPTSAWPSCPNPNQVPTPDPNEGFDNVTNQLFGTKTPAPGQIANMSGFLQDYSTTDAGVASAGQIMQIYGPDQASVINALARNFAVCDHWFASVPSQTWPNRGFVHTGSSDGHVDNDNYEWYQIPTLFNVLQDQGKSWSIFCSGDVVSLTYWQFPYLGGYRDQVRDYSEFKQRCAVAEDADAATQLPAYSFIEPRFQPDFLGTAQPEDYHPPHNLCRGETFLAEVYNTVRTSPYRDKILLVVLFDEHGGCYDHVPPPTGAIAPQPCPVSRDGKFKFDRFGVRVPAIVISSYVEPGTVFRASPGEPPFDHTSLLATIRDWPFLNLDKTKFLPSPRIAAAPTIDRVLTRVAGQENAAWPAITPACVIDQSDVSPDTPLNDIQKSLIAAQKVLGDGEHPGATVQQANQEAKALQTYAHGASYLQPDATG